MDRVGSPELPRCGLAGNLRERDTSRVAPVVGNRVSGAGTMPAESQIEGGRNSSRCGGATQCKGRSPPLRNIIRRLVSQHPRCTLCQYPCANCSARQGRARAKARTAADGAWCCAPTYGAGGQKFWGRHRDRWELRSHPSPPTGTGGVVPLSPQGHPNWGARSPAPPRDRAGAGPGGRPGPRSRRPPLASAILVGILRDHLGWLRTGTGTLTRDASTSRLIRPSAGCVCAQAIAAHKRPRNTNLPDRTAENSQGRATEKVRFEGGAVRHACFAPGVRERLARSRCNTGLQDGLRA